MASPKTVVKRISHHYRPWLTAREVEAKMNDDAQSGNFGFSTGDVPTRRGISNMLRRRRSLPESPAWRPIGSDMSPAEIRNVLVVLRATAIESEGRVLNFSVVEAQAIRMVTGVVPDMRSNLVYLFARDLLSTEDTTGLDLFLAFATEPHLTDQEKKWATKFAEMGVDWPTD